MATDIVHDSALPVKNFTDFYTIAPHEFIQVLFGNVPNGFLEIAYLANEGDKLYPHTVVNWVEMPLPQIDPEMPGIHRMNGKGYNCYFAPCIRSQYYEPEQRQNDYGKTYTMYPRGKAKDALWLTALWVDVDKAGDEGRKQLLNSDLPQPTILVYSGGGWHGYWLLIEPLLITDDNRADIKLTLKGMALACGGDTSVADLARIMRLPGTINTKPNRGNLCEVYDYFPAQFHYQELELNCLPLAKPKTPQVTRRLPQAAFDRVPHWVANYITSGSSQGRRNRTLFQASCDCFNNGMSLSEVDNLLRTRAASDGLDEHEITRTIESAYGHERGESKLPTHMTQRMAMGDHKGARS